MQLSHANERYDWRVTTLLLLGVLLLLAPAASAASGAVVSGVVRDAQGVAQMGALVQVLTGDSAAVGMAFTDARGRYTISNLTSGRYLVRASATLFMPATRTNLQLRTGTTSVVNLTLAALFDTTSWLPAERRRADEPADDWKWTLRSTANRPILRIVEGGTLIVVSSSAANEGKAPVKTNVRATVTSGDGQFGAGGVHNILSIHRSMDDGGDMMLRADIGSTRVPAAYGPSQEFDAGYERHEGFNGAARTVLSYKAHPELLATGMTTGLQAFSSTSAERMSLAELIEVEAGGQLAVVNSGRIAVAARPFVQVSTRPMGVWTLHYRMATDRHVQSFGDVTTGQSDVPVALVRNGRLALESGRHQEASVDRRIGRGTLTAAYFHDAIGQTAVSGAGSSGPAETTASEIPIGMLVDPTTGSFRVLTSGYKTDGARFTVSTPLLKGLWIAAEYSSGRAIVSETGGATAFADALSALKPKSSQTATIAIKGKLNGSGTRLRAAYRWQPASLVTAVDPYSTFSDQAFLSCQFRQPIHLGSHLPQGLDATIDVTNLLAEGYRPFLSADGQTLYFAQAPRTLQGGLSFTF